MNQFEMNKRIAELIGWKCEWEDSYWPNKELVWRNRLGFRELEPDFTTNRNRLPILLHEIAQHNLQVDYINLLLGLNDSVVVDITAVFDAIMALPLQHCRVFLELMNERVEK